MKIYFLITRLIITSANKSYGMSHFSSYRNSKTNIGTIFPNNLCEMTSVSVKIWRNNTSSLLVPFLCSHISISHIFSATPSTCEILTCTLILFFCSGIIHLLLFLHILSPLLRTIGKCPINSDWRNTMISSHFVMGSACSSVIVLINLRINFVGIFIWYN